MSNIDSDKINNGCSEWYKVMSLCVGILGTVMSI